MEIPATSKLWIVTEGLAGTENQCLGLAQAMGIQPQVYQIGLRAPWSLLSPYLGLETKGTFDPARFVPTPPWPDVLIASGRKAIAAARYIKKNSPRTFCVFVQDPRISSSAFDLVVVPSHDPTRGKNVVTTIGAPNRVTPERLAAARVDFPVLSSMKSPRVAVLIGGSNKIYTMTENITRQLADQLQTLSHSHGLMITTSRRTGIENHKILQKALAGTDAYLWDNIGPNPYFAFLAYADAILCTSDSVAMLSDAATTGKPVYRIPLQGDSVRFSRFYKDLEESGAVRVFSGQIDYWTYPPLDEAHRVAHIIKAKMKEKGCLYA